MQNMAVKSETRRKINTHKSNVSNTKRKFTTKQMVIIAMFSALSYVLMLLKLPISYLGFLEFEFSDIPALVAGLGYGPMTAVIIELIKNLIKAFTSSFTGGVGELANFAISASYMFTICSLYKILKGRRKIITCCTVGTVVMTLIGALMNYFVMLPLYAVVFGGMDGIIEIANKTIPAINSVEKLVIIGISPFNLFKGAYIGLVGYWVYKLIRSALRED